jgi:hypothetical protein
MFSLGYPWLRWIQSILVCLTSNQNTEKHAKRKEGKSMNRLNYLLVTALLIASFSLHGLSQNPPAQNPTAPKPADQKPPDPCAQLKKAPKNETDADKKKRQADLKSCTDKEKADAKAAKDAAKKGTK